VWSAQRPLLEGRASIVMDVRFGAVIADPETLP
jgi:hypothetical protein